jgi:NADH-quinone oxidoreductase subunit L
MVAAVGMGAFVAGMFHLVTHAFFKALLFLSAGSVILGMERGHHHLSHHKGHTVRAANAGATPVRDGKGHEGKHAEEVFDPGDMRNMGGLRKTMPVTFWLYMIGTLALAGIVPFAGFWSKDEILLDASLHYTGVYILLSIAAFFTAFYMGRQIWMVFFGEPRHEAAAHAEESKPIITVPLMVLAGLSLLGGALNLPFDGFHNLGHWLEYTLHEVEALPLNLQVAGISTVLALIAIFIAWLIYGRNPLKTGQLDPLKKSLSFIFTGMENKWFVDEGYWAVFINPFVKGSQFLADVIDWRFWHDWFHDKVVAGTYNWLSNIGLNLYADQRGIDALANALGRWTKDLSASMRKVQNGFVRSYALSVLLGVVLILGYLLLK